MSPSTNDFPYAFDKTLAGPDVRVLLDLAGRATDSVRAFAAQRFRGEFALLCDSRSSAIYGSGQQPLATGEVSLSLMLRLAADADTFQDAFAADGWTRWQEAV